jgi:streptogramin lyase
MTDFNNDVIHRADLRRRPDRRGGRRRRRRVVRGEQPAGRDRSLRRDDDDADPVLSGAVPPEITVATDGDIWFTERFSPQGVGRLDPATNAIAEFPLTNVGPQSLAPAPRGAVWFTQTTTGNAARIDDGGPGTYLEGKAVKGSEPFGIVVAADGTSGYTETAANKIAELQLK